MRFQKGDIVKIAKNSDIQKNRCFPRNTEGVVTEIDMTNDIGDQGYYVGVSYNGMSYGGMHRESDLRLVRRES